MCERPPQLGMQVFIVSASIVPWHGGSQRNYGFGACTPPPAHSQGRWPRSGVGWWTIFILLLVLKYNFEFSSH